MNNNKKSQFFNTREETVKWLDKYYVYNYIINDDLSVDVNGNVDISRKNLKFIPIKFGKITGHFWCYKNQLTSLVGSPESVGDFFDCDDNQLTNLVGSPKHIESDFLCIHNYLLSLSEIIDCNFKGNIFFNIDENNFQQKELIQVLEKYYNKKYNCYVLSNNKFHDIIKPQIEKESLQQKLNISKTKIQTKTSFL